MLIKFSTGASAFAVRRILPGLALTLGIAGAASVLARITGWAYLSPIVAALAFGALLRAVVGPLEWAKAGIDFSIRAVLRSAIALLGLQIALLDIAGIGVTGLAGIVGIVLATMTFTIWLGRQLKVGPDLTYLIAAGTSICGAAAILATATTLRARDEEVGYAIASITVFGTLSIVLYPICQLLIELNDYSYGFWVGVSIHEVAQVVAAGFQSGAVAGEQSVITKLARVLLLAPVVMVIAAFSGKSDRATIKPIPVFILAFLGFMLIGNLIEISPAVRDAISKLTLFLFCVSLAGVGLAMNVQKLSKSGLRPLVLAAASWIFVASLGLLLVLQLRPN